MGQNLKRFDKWCTFGAIWSDLIGRLLIHERNMALSEIKENVERQFPSYKNDVDWKKLETYYLSKHRNLRYNLTNGTKT